MCRGMFSLGELNILRDRKMASPQEIAAYASLNETVVDERMSRQYERQRQIITETNSFCDYEEKGEVVTAKEVKHIMKESFDDAEILHALLCFNNSLTFYPSNSYGLTRDVNIRRYFTELVKMPGESSSNVMASHVMDSSYAPYVVKAPKTREIYALNEFMHEYFVGVYGTNRLRDRIPNFAYVMGMFPCSLPFLAPAYMFKDPSERIGKIMAAAWCQNDQSAVNYVIYENVTESMTLHEFIKGGCSFEEFLNVFVQIVLALQMANEEFDYTHYDLHNQNVLVKRLPEPIYINYFSWYLKTDHVATIIDQESAHIGYGGESFTRPTGGVDPYRSFPLQDVFKLLMFCLESSMPRALWEVTYDDSEYEPINRQVFDSAKGLVGWFYDEVDPNRIFEYVDRTRPYYFVLPYSEVEPIDFFTTALLPAYGEIIAGFLTTERPEGRIYGSGRRREIDYVGPPDSLRDPYVFFRLYSSSPSEELRRLGEKLCPGWVIDLNAQRCTVYNNLDSAEAVLSRYGGFDTTPIFSLQAEQVLANIVYLFNELRTLQEMIDVCSFLTNTFPAESKGPLFELKTSLDKKKREISPFSNLYMNSLLRRVREIQALSGDEQADDLLKRYGVAVDAIRKI